MAIEAFDTVNDYSWIQTFYVDPDNIAGSSEIAITSVNLYFKRKPKKNKNASGKANPGVIVRICQVDNDEPNLGKVYHQAAAYKSFDDIYSFSDASTSTSFSFDTPIKLPTGRFYGVVVIFEDPGYELWVNKAGDKLLGTTRASPGSNLVKDGKLYQYNNSGVFRPLSDTDLKFCVNIAQYTSNTQNEVYVNKPYEFFSCSWIGGRFFGGEWVYQEVANATGNVAFTAGERYVTGDGTTFTSDVSKGDRIVVFANSSYNQMLHVREVVNNTFLETYTKIVASNTETNYMVPPCGRVHWFHRGRKRLYLSDSNANSALKFAVNSNLIRGIDSGVTCNLASIDNKNVDRVNIRGSVNIPPAGQIISKFAFAHLDGSDIKFDIGNLKHFNFAGRDDRFDRRHRRLHRIRHYNGFLCSRSFEVDNANLHSNSDLLIDRKSFVCNADLTTTAPNTNLYESPSIEDNELDVYVIENDISNTYTTTDSNSVVIDTEVAGDGIALCKHYGIKFGFANNRAAEDVRVYMTAYRPPGTDIKVYARVHNSADPEPFDDKAWSPLEYKTNENTYSSSDDEDDLIEFELGLPQYSDSANTLPGTFTTQSGNAVMAAAGVNPTTYVDVNDVVKLYNPLIPENYIVGVVAAANSTTITLGAPVSNNNVVGSGYKVDRLKYYYSAFNNYTNDNVARYYNSSFVEYDTFNNMQVKVVLLSDTTYQTPEVDSLNVIGVSA